MTSQASLQSSTAAVLSGTATAQLTKAATAKESTPPAAQPISSPQADQQNVKDSQSIFSSCSCCCEKWEAITLIAVGALAILASVGLWALNASNIFTPFTPFTLKFVCAGGVVLGCALIALGLYKLWHKESPAPATSTPPATVTPPATAPTAPEPLLPPPPINEMLATPLSQLFPPKTDIGKVSHTPKLDKFISYAKSIKAQLHVILQKAIDNLEEKYRAAKNPDLTLGDWFQRWTELWAAWQTIGELKTSFKCSLLQPTESKCPVYDTMEVIYKRTVEPLELCAKRYDLGDYNDKSSPLARLYDESGKVYAQIWSKAAESMNKWAEEDASLSEGDKKTVKTSADEIADIGKKAPKTTSSGGTLTVSLN